MIIGLADVSVSARDEIAVAREIIGAGMHVKDIK